MSFVEKIAGKMWENTAKIDAKRIALQRPTPGSRRSRILLTCRMGIAAICWMFIIRRARASRCR